SGKFLAQIRWRDRKCNAYFHVIPCYDATLLSYATAEALGLVTINAIHTSESEQCVNDDFQKILDEFPEVTNGIGKLKDFQAKIYMDESIPPTVNTRYRIPLHLRDKVEERLKWLLENDIIERATGPTTWVSPIAIAPKKNGVIRI